MFRQWDDLPDFFKCPEVKPYWEILSRRRRQLYVKRIFDFWAAILLLLILAVPMIIIAVLIKIDSEGSVLYRQERITLYGKKFRIHKFRTMTPSSDKAGPLLTVCRDSRITKFGKILRRSRLDELPQLFDVIKGDMSFVGTRPEVLKYVRQYEKEYMATLLMPAGITSEASIRFKDEERLLKNSDDVDRVYLEKIVPAKMKLNLKGIREFSLLRDACILVSTFFSVF